MCTAGISLTFSVAPIVDIQESGIIAWVIIKNTAVTKNNLPSTKHN